LPRLFWVAWCTPNFRNDEQALPDTRQGTVSKYHDNANLEGLEQARFSGFLGDGSVLPEMSMDVQESRIVRGMSLPAPAALSRAGMLRKRTARRLMTAPWRRAKFGRQRLGGGWGGRGGGGVMQAWRQSAIIPKGKRKLLVEET
jgi:hypothetical protein